MNKKTVTGRKWMTQPIMDIHNGCYTNILQRINELLIYTSKRYAKVLTIQGILHLPDSYNYNDTEVITRFFKSLNEKLNYQYSKALRNSKHANWPGMEYIWVREVGSDNRSPGKPHYHFCIFLNGHAYSRLGIYCPEQQTLFSKIVHSWRSALETKFLYSPFVFSPSLVTFTKNGQTRLERYDGNSLDSFNREHANEYRKLFLRLSYFAKVNTKTSNDGIRNFGSSRIPRNYEAVNRHAGQYTTKQGV
ncbi:inovirus Gp2 family protein [Alteromonas sp. 5E99-2]|uniref:inovirus Gp2 family protein n=1 Tax=Alteromonas sp. 5E99-2 TaxID=2817683 RepID=UPI001A981D51|nr:inovirus Gp2 family protein [Alteromonas sp. 5E99-2]MBO1254897.1 inovirus Gp2 family protein [Alteromonas sp. 5E99-2]